MAAEATRREATMTEAQRELEQRMTAIIQRLRASPLVRTSLAGLDRPAQAARLAELTVLELKAEPEGLELMQRAGVKK
jgi:hypothetical protein